MRSTIVFGITSCLSFQVIVATYTLVRDYSSANFFSKWDFYGNWDNLTSGDVQYLTEADAFARNLTYVNSKGNAIVKVDNTTDVIFNDKRNSIRITSQDEYSIGSLWVIDAVHIPYGCSVWPGFWSTGALWPNDGEIDIIEAVNLMDHNQMALHSTQGCMQATNPGQTGITSETGCMTDAGCVVAETKPNSYGSGFAQANGGVFAAQFDVSGIFMWFWSRSNVPNSISYSTSSSSIDISDWGLPTASYPASACNITQFFGPQRLVLDITLCGIWAGLPVIYSATCSNTGATGQCYNDNVVGAGSPKYDNAYFEVSFIRAYSIATTLSSPSPSILQSPALSTPLALLTSSSSQSLPTVEGSEGSATRPLASTTASSASMSSSAVWAYFSPFYIMFLGLWISLFGNFHM